MNSHPQIGAPDRARNPRAAVAAILATIFASLAAVVAVAGPSSAAPSMVAVYPLWWNSPSTVAAASSAGPILAAGGAPFVVQVGADRPGLAARLRASGAFILLSPAAAALCGAPPPEPQT